MEGIPPHAVLATRHSRAPGNPGLFSSQLAWISAFAGTERCESLAYSGSSFDRSSPRTYFRRRHEAREINRRKDKIVKNWGAGSKAQRVVLVISTAGRNLSGSSPSRDCGCLISSAYSRDLRRISLFVRNDTKGHFAPLLETSAATPPR
jgi:hypothetical protein